MDFRILARASNVYSQIEFHDLVNISFHIMHVHLFVTKVKPSTITNAGDGLFLASGVAPQGTALIEEQAVSFLDACMNACLVVCNF